MFTHSFQSVPILQFSAMAVIKYAVLTVVTILFVIFADVVVAWMEVLTLALAFPPVWFVSQCGCDSGDCSGDSGGGSCGSGSDSSGSTPFLELAKPDGSMQILNDVMVGSPSSLFRNLAQGAAAFERGEVGYDVYAVPVSLVGQRVSELNFILKEIEIEQSVIARFEYATAVVPDGKELMTSDTYQQPLIANTTAPVGGKVQHSSGRDVSKQLSANFQMPLEHNKPVAQSVLLNPGESLQFNIAKVGNGETYVATASFWRQMIGYEHYLATVASKQAVAAIRSPFARALVRPLAYVSAFAFSLVSLFGFGSTNVDDSLLKLSYKPFTAHASTPSGKSLYYYYQDAAQNWVHFSTIHPRFNVSDRALSLVPESAFIQDDIATIKVVANAQHYITALEVAGDVEELSATEFTPISGSLNGTSHVATTESPLRTNPGDAYTFSAAVPPTATHVLVKIHGYYSPMKPHRDTEVHDWWSKLTPQERAIFDQS